VGSGNTQEQKKETDGFTDRAIMSLVMEAADLKEMAMRIVAVVVYQPKSE
jgi:hypothetical protein